MARGEKAKINTLYPHLSFVSPSLSLPLSIDAIPLLCVGIRYMVRESQVYCVSVCACVPGAVPCGFESFFFLSFENHLKIIKLMLFSSNCAHELL